MASKDQRTIDVVETKVEKYNRGLDLFIESLHKPDHHLRACAHNQKCYNELMQIKEEITAYCNTLRKHNSEYNRDVDYNCDI